MLYIYTHTHKASRGAVISVVKISYVKEDATKERRNRIISGTELADIFIFLRNLLTAARDSNDSSTIAAVIIANFIRKGAW